MFLSEAAKALGVIRAKSSLYRTPAFPAGSGPDFVNAAFSVETDLNPREVLACLHDAEKRFGRVRQQRWAARTLDLDLIAYENQILPDLSTYSYWAELPLEEQQKKAPEELVLPHPRLHERAFVLVPLNDIAPDWVHPVTGKSVSQMLKSLPKSAKAEVCRL